MEAAKRATSTIPIVMPVSGDPVRAGLVASLARPGGNITGLTSLSGELPGKWMELLKETLPRVSRVAVLWDPASDPKQVNTSEAAARSLGVRLHTLKVGRADGFEPAFDRRDETMTWGRSSSWVRHSSMCTEPASSNSRPSTGYRQSMLSGSSS